jgi:hypothetical protein
MTARKPRVAPPEGDSIAEALRRQALIVEHLYDGVMPLTGRRRPDQTGGAAVTAAAK